jgi:hypothetical protein
VQRCEDPFVKEFIPEFPVEALDITVLPRTARLNENANFKEQLIFFRWVAPVLLKFEDVLLLRSSYGGQEIEDCSSALM